MGGEDLAEALTAPSPPAEDASDPAEELAALGARVGELIELLGSHADPEVGSRVEELLGAFDALHREALVRLAGLLAHHQLLEHACEDPVVGEVFELYELRPEDPRAEIEKALEPVRPYIASHGGEVEVLGVSEGVVRLRLGGSCHGCSGSATTLKRGVERALREGWPGFRKMVVEESTPEPARGGRSGSGPVMPSTPLAMSSPGSSFISLGDVARTARPPAGGEPAAPANRPDAAPAAAESPVAPEWSDVCAVDEVQPGTMHAPDAGALLLVNLDGEIYAYRNGCGDGPLPLHMGKLQGDRLVCPWHLGCIYDVTTGLSGEPPDVRRLVTYPVAAEGGRIRVAMNKGTTAPLLQPA